MFHKAPCENFLRFVCFIPKKPVFLGICGFCKYLFNALKCWFFQTPRNLRPREGDRAKDFGVPHLFDDQNAWENTHTIHVSHNSCVIIWLCFAYVYIYICILDIIYYTYIYIVYILLPGKPSALFLRQKLLVLGVKLPKKIGHLAFQVVVVFCDPGEKVLLPGVL